MASIYAMFKTTPAEDEWGKVKRTTLIINDISLWAVIIFGVAWLLASMNMLKIVLMTIFF